MPAYESQPYDNLIAGYTVPLTNVSIIVKSGSGVIKRGTVLGVVSQLPETNAFHGMYIVAPVDSSKTDGSQLPFAILSDQEVDATTKDVRATGYVGGEFNRHALIFGGADKVEKHEVEMRNIGLIIKRVVE
ncbi:head decoration protein [Paenibacillus farraposensis]|uniref:Head decoration protein n=1 Tax=Paenibacillus farraposensis TaxID=2807095 RepID=A0ABW4DA90_9BACL|nr:head decoration protein [Paenibacillus farraposensis]MCC3379908.1 head decoration protein [Paenibacillus farraposensis]